MKHTEPDPVDEHFRIKFDVARQLQRRWPHLVVETDGWNRYGYATVPRQFWNEFGQAYGLLVDHGHFYGREPKPCELAGALFRQWDWSESPGKKGLVPYGDSKRLLPLGISGSFTAAALGALLRPVSPDLPIVVLKALGIRVQGSAVCLEIPGVDHEEVTVAHFTPLRPVPELTPGLIRRVHKAIAAWHAAAPLDHLVARHAKHRQEPIPQDESRLQYPPLDHRRTTRPAPRGAIASD